MHLIFQYQKRSTTKESKKIKTGAVWTFSVYRYAYLMRQENDEYPACTLPQPTPKPLNVIFNDKKGLYNEPCKGKKCSKTNIECNIKAPKLKHLHFTQCGQVKTPIKFIYEANMECCHCGKEG